MADDNKRSDEPEDGEQEAQAPSKSRRKWWLVGGLMLLLAVLGVVITLFLLGTFSEDGEPDESEQASVVAPPSSAAIYYPLNPEFISNYDVRGRQRFLKVEMTLMLRESDVISAIELHMPALRNTLVMLLRGQVYEELQTPEGKELLRQRSLLAIQAVLEAEIGKPGIEQVLFTNLVMQ